MELRGARLDLRGMSVSYSFLSSAASLTHLACVAERKFYALFLGSECVLSNPGEGTNPPSVSLQTAEEG